MQVPDSTRGENRSLPVPTLVLGLFPSLVVARTLESGVWVGLALALVLVGSVAVAWPLRAWIPRSARTPVALTAMATWAGVADMALKAYQPEIAASFGIYVLVMAANPLILVWAGGQEANRQTAGGLLAGTLRLGAWLLAGPALVGALRELLGTGSLSLFGRALLSAGGNWSGVGVIQQIPGAFLLPGLLLAAGGAWRHRRAGSGDDSTATVQTEGGRLP